MNRTEFEELEIQVLPKRPVIEVATTDRSYCYSTYHYWQKKYSAEKDSIKQELAPINIKRCHLQTCCPLGLHSY